MGDPNNPDGYEVKHTDLNGIIFDIATRGGVQAFTWTTSCGELRGLICPWNNRRKAAAKRP